MQHRRISSYLLCHVEVLVWHLAFIFAIPLSVAAQQSGGGSLQFKLLAGYSAENLDWSIAGKNANAEAINILSELDWKKTGGVYLDLHGKWRVWKDLFVHASFSKTFVTSGTVSDTDFSKDNRGDTLFHDTFNSNKGGVICYNAAVGYKFHFLKKHSIAPFAGYGNDSQSLYIFRDNGNVQGDLKSTYQTKWNGFLVGLNLGICLNEKLTAGGQITYHQVSYSAEADWNLVTDFKHPVSFEHHAKGYGITTEAGLEYLMSKKISAMFTIRHGYWVTGKGTDTLYRSNGNIAVTQLNSVHRSNLTFSAGVQITFD